MSGFQVISSGLSQWVVRDGVPYSVEIYQLQGDAFWTLQIIEAQERKTLWENQLSDEVLAFVEAVSVIDVYGKNGATANLQTHFTLN